MSDDLFFYCNVGLRGLRSDKVHCLKEVSGLYHQWGDKERYSYLFALKQKGTQVYQQYTKSIILKNQLNQSNSYPLSQVGKESDYQINFKKATFQFSVVVFGQIWET